MWRSGGSGRTGDEPEEVVGDRQPREALSDARLACTLEGLPLGELAVFVCQEDLTYLWLLPCSLLARVA